MCLWHLGRLIGEVADGPVKAAELHLHVQEAAVQLFSIGPLHLGALLDVGADLCFASHLRLLLSLQGGLGGLDVLLLLLLGLFDLLKSFKNHLLQALVDCLRLLRMPKGTVPVVPVCQMPEAHRSLRDSKLLLVLGQNVQAPDLTLHPEFLGLASHLVRLILQGALYVDRMWCLCLTMLGDALGIVTNFDSIACTRSCCLRHQFW